MKFLNPEADQKTKGILKPVRHFFSFLILSGFLLGMTGGMHEAAAYLFAYPEKDQTPEQQTLDDEACQKEARKKTNFDPSVSISRVAQSAEEIAKKRKEEQSRERQLQKFEKIYSDCMKKRGYAVPKPAA